MNQYETVFILTPVLSDNQMKGSGREIQRSFWQRRNYHKWRKLGLKSWFTQFKKSTGFYALIEFDVEPQVIKIETQFRRWKVLC